MVLSHLQLSKGILSLTMAVSIAFIQLLNFLFVLKFIMTQTKRNELLFFVFFVLIITENYFTNFKLYSFSI